MPREDGSQKPCRPVLVIDGDETTPTAIAVNEIMETLERHMGPARDFSRSIHFLLCALGNLVAAIKDTKQRETALADISQRLPEVVAGLVDYNREKEAPRPKPNRRVN